ATSAAGVEQPPRHIGLARITSSRRFDGSCAISEDVCSSPTKWVSEKTIEACLALKEYWVRGLVSKALILTPASLVGQWVDELTSKFGLAAVSAEGGKVSPDDDAWDRHRSWSRRFRWSASAPSGPV